MEIVAATTTAYGRPAFELLAREVDELKAGDALAPVTVLVPSNYAAVAARRALAARRGGVANVTFVTLHRLAERLGGPVLAAAGRRPVSAPVVAAAVRSTLADAPGVFAPVADHPATEAALVTAHRELADVTDDALDAVAACSARAADVVRIHRAVRARLAGEWFDESDLLAAAAAAVPAGVGPIVVHLLHELSVSGGRFLRALTGATAVRVNVGITGDADADAPVVAAHARAGIDVPAAPGIEPGCASHLVSASDPDDEVRAAIRLVAEWMRAGVNLGRIAIVYGMADPYARLLHEHLGAAGVPFNGVPVRAVGDLLLGRALRGLLALPDRGYRRDDVLAALTGAPLLDAGGRHVHTRAWEQVSRAAGIVGGDDWHVRLAHYAAEQRRKADQDEQDENDRRAAHRRREAHRADELVAFVARVRADLDRGAELNTWAGFVGWVEHLVATYLGDEGHRATWPDDERRAAERVEAALDRLAGLDEIDGLTPTVEVFRRALDGELEVAGRRIGRLGEGVLVGPASITAGLVLDRVVVLGMAEGAFPPRRVEDSLLPDAERERAGGQLALRAHRIHDDRRYLLAAVAAADRAVLCHPRGDLRRSGERPASRWLLADAARLACVPSVRSDDLVHHAGEPWLEHVGSFAGGLARAAIAATEQELRLGAIARGDRRHSVLVGDARLADALDVVTSRRSSAFTRFDGNLAAVAAELPRPESVSASRLQTFAACPHAYLMQYVLGVDHVEEPERRVQIDPVDVGTLVHDILDDFVKGAIDAGHPLDRWTDADRARLERIAREQFAGAEAEGKTGREVFWRRDRAQILADLDRFVTEDNFRLATGLRPLATEVEIREVDVKLPSGRVLRLNGSIDRVDRAVTGGSLVVLDYKTGSDARYKGLGVDDPHVGGRHLQLYLYAAAASAMFGDGAPVAAFYWFNTSKRGFRRVGYTVTPEIADDVGSAVDTILDGIAAGAFPARPSEKPPWMWVECWFCTPDGLGAAERRREWERKRHDPTLAAYVSLAEPGAEA